MSQILISVISVILLLAVVSGIAAPVHTQASGSYALATPSTPSSAPAIASPATPSVARKATMEEALYTLCGYSFWYADRPMEWEFGDSTGIEDELSYISAIDVYLDGPEGHVEDSLYLDVTWDISQVDFLKEGDYTVTGTLDTSACEYPVNWDDTPAPSFTIQIRKGGVLSFQTAVSGDTLTLSYEMNGEPFLFSPGIFSFFLYESRDGGANWQNISHSNRAQISETGITVSGITPDSLFQMTKLQLGGFFSRNSDIVEITGTPGDLSSVLIESDGEPGGGLPSDGNWDDTPVLDGPYPISNYTTQNNWMNAPLEIPIERGNQNSLSEHKDYYNLINVHYGDDSYGFWSDKVLLPVQWDWAAADSIDWEKAGDTVIYGNFSEETIQDCEVPLDFEHMPELTLTISVYDPEPDLIPFTLYSREEALLEGNTVEFLFCNDYNEPITFTDVSGLTVWCSTDGGENWYNITESSHVSLEHDSLSVSGLKDSILRSEMGYTFQAEQKSLSDYSEFSTPMTVTHDVTWGISISQSTGGERGGGKRQEKPPEGLFDPEESEEEETTSPVAPPETEATSPVAPPETETTSPVVPPETETTSPVAPPETEATSPVAPPETEATSPVAPPETETVSPGNSEDDREVFTTAPSEISTTPASSTRALETAMTAPAIAAVSPISSPETDASATTIAETSTIPENTEESQEMINKPASQKPSSHGTLRVLLSTTAVLAGAGAGFWMIRRR